MALAALERTERERTLLSADRFVAGSAALGIPVGSIGPTRARAIQQLRTSRALRHLAPPDGRNR